MNASQRFQLVKLLNKTVSFLYYQYGDLDRYLEEQGAEQLRKNMHDQFRTLLEAKRRLTFLKKAPQIGGP